MKIFSGLVFVFLILTVPAFAWDPIRDITGKSLDKHGKSILKDLKNAPKSWGNCAKNVGKCAEKEIRRLPYRSVQPIIDRYKLHLFNQGNGRWKSLPPNLTQALQAHYSANLSHVAYAEDINTLHGQAITWGNKIFFPKAIDLETNDDLHWILHELEHVVQYQRKGGEREFLSQYALKSVGKIIERGSFNVHDYVDIERAADAKADQLLPIAVEAMTAPRDPRPKLPRSEARVRELPPLGRFCTTQFGTCRLRRPVPIQMDCLCFGPGGRPDQGVAH
jgi:Domain of unknown function (DUF4157)